MKTILTFITVSIAISLQAQDTITLAFGSCNKTSLDQSYWQNIKAANPSHFFWLGDAVYADTDNMDELALFYTKQNSDSNYYEFKKIVAVDGTWDDHDYGVNDGGCEFKAKKGSKAEFVKFLGFDGKHSINNHEGVYHSSSIVQNGLIIKTLFLDTRYFRTELAFNPERGKRYQPINKGSILGKTQWSWLEKELNDTTVDLFIIASSIQAIANNHYYEKWGNMTHERERLFKLLKNKPSVIISGDRHIAEFSAIDNGKYKLYDFTSSGLTHTWRKYQFESNPNRIGKQFAVVNYGLLTIWQEEDYLNVEIQIKDPYTNTTLQQLSLMFD